MLPGSMKRLVGPQSRLKEDIIPEGNFAEAGRVLQVYIDSVGKRKRKTIVVP